MPLNRLLLLFTYCALAIASSMGQTPEKKPYVIYAQFVEDTQVELSDGAQWMMEKGDCFPIYMFKDRQTKVVLQLAGATFWTEVYRVRILKDGKQPEAEERYRKMVESYLKSKATKGGKEAKS